MEIQPRRGGLDHAHINRHQLVEGHAKLGRRNGGDVGVEMHHLANGVHPRVGPAGGGYGYIMAVHGAQRLLQLALHRAAV